jgi:hypothetical protein
MTSKQQSNTEYGTSPFEVFVSSGANNFSQIVAGWASRAGGSAASYVSSISSDTVAYISGGYDGGWDPITNYANELKATARINYTATSGNYGAGSTYGTPGGSGAVRLIYGKDRSFPYNAA